MPGPKMGLRPPDFDEDLVKQSPTFIKWMGLAEGQKLRYACRDFIKGQGEDEERLMRRIMIARRNNLRDHHVLKRARQMSSQSNHGPMEKVAKLDHQSFEKQVDPADKLAQETSRKRRPSTLFSDAYVAKEMDVPAVEATRSYRRWLTLPDGAEFVYNQKYTKGRDGHDWLLKKNIWRRMRYRRENKKMVEQLRRIHPSAGTTEDNESAPGMAPQIVDESLLTTHSILAADVVTRAGVDRIAEKEGGYEEVSAAVEAAMGVAETYAKSPYDVVHNPLETVTNTAALDAAARLAAAASSGVDDDAVAAAEAAAQHQSTIDV